MNNYKNLTALLLLFALDTGLFSQSSRIQIIGWVAIPDISSSENINACLNSNPVLDANPSPMAGRIAKKIIQSLANYRHYEMLTGEDGYDDKLVWTITKVENSLKVEIMTKSVWLKNLTFRYIEHYAASDCLRWYYLKKTDPPMMFETKGIERESPVIVPLAQDQYISQSSKGLNTASVLPKPSSKMALPSYLFDNVSNLGNLNAIFSNVLDISGYTERGYFEYDNGGFEIITQIEETNENGDRIRWLSADPRKFYEYTIWDYLRMMLFENIGYYRMLVIKYDPGIAQMSYYDSFSTIKGNRIYQESNDKLSAAHLAKQFAKTWQAESNVSAFIYEFKCSEYDKEAIQISKGRFTTIEHLRRNKLWENLHYITGKRP